MDGNQLFEASFFPASQAIINGGTFNSIQHSHSHSGAKDGYDRLLEIVAPNALHNSGHIFDPPKCHPGTRVAVIQAIMDWLAGVDPGTREKGVNWLTGAAGAGKSAIGRSVCERCSLERTLLASFFFGSRDSTRNHSQRLVATIAYQICGIHHTIRTAVSNYIAYDPLIFTKSLRTQFTSLVMDPLLIFYSAEGQNTPRLIVLDGLDECIDHSSQRDILETVVHLIKSYSPCPIRFLICSRPESNIKNFIQGAQMNPMVFKISLGNEYAAQKDIEKYLHDNFQEIREGHVRKYSIPEGWPGKDNIKQLVKTSSGQFIYASTVINFTKSHKHRPDQRLAIVLGLRPPKENDLPFVQLDALYTQILQSTMDAFLAVKILGYAAMYQHISIPVIEAYLESEDGDVEDILLDLASIVLMRRVRDETFCRLYLLHKSFEDFLFDKSRSQGLYLMSSADTRASHFVRSLEIFSTRRQDCLFRENRAYPTDCPHPINFKPQELVDAIPTCTEAMQEEVFDAIVQFPMESFFQDLCPNHIDQRCSESQFAARINFIVGELKRQHDRYASDDFYNQYLATLFRCVLLYLRTEDGFNDLGENFRFVNDCIKACNERVLFTTFLTPLHFLDRALRAGLCDTSDADSHDIRPLLRDGFHKILTVSERSRIVSRAVLYCLKYLCDVDGAAKVEAKMPLHLEGIHRKTRYSRPWKWHMRTSFYNIRKYEKRPVLSHHVMWRLERNYLSTYEKLCKIKFPTLPNADMHKVSISSVLSEYDRARQSRIIEWRIYWNCYIDYLEYLPKILPMAGPDSDVIEFCKKAFAPMSMKFPTLSRRARRAIYEYLKRMESNDGSPNSEAESGRRRKRFD